MTYQRNETPEPLASGVLSAFEEMMPEPAFAPTEGLLAGMPLYTADQLRTAMQAAWEAATERAAKEGRADGVVVAAYAMPTPAGAIDEVRIERARQMRGPDLWAVRYRGDVLNKDGEWEWEPMPSGRDEAFLARARFDNAEEAIAAAIRGTK